MWFQGRGHRLLSSLDEGIWSSIELILFRLVAGGLLSTWTVLQGLVFPIWASAIDDSVAPPITAIHGANSVARRLLLVDTPLPTVVHDSDSTALVEAQRLLGQHGVIHTRAETIAFFTAISHLVLLEDRKGLPEHVQAASTALRIGICSCVTFRCLAMRYIEDVRGILCRSTSIDATGTASEDTLVETLAMLIMPQDCGMYIFKRFTNTQLILIHNCRLSYSKGRDREYVSARHVRHRRHIASHDSVELLDCHDRAPTVFQASLDCSD